MGSRNAANLKRRFSSVLKEYIQYQIKVLSEGSTGKIETLIRPTKDIDKNKEFRNYKYAIAERPPIKLSDGNWLHVYRVTNHNDGPHGDVDVEQDAFDREMYENRKGRLSEDRLKASWELKDELANMDMPDDLRKEVDRFIELHDGSSTGKPQNYSNLYYRSNLHYIIDNIENPGLIGQLKKFNELKGMKN